MSSAEKLIKLCQDLGLDPTLTKREAYGDLWVEIRGDYVGDGIRRFLCAGEMDLALSWARRRASEKGIL